MYKPLRRQQLLLPLYSTFTPPVSPLTDLTKGTRLIGPHGFTVEQARYNRSIHTAEEGAARGYSTSRTPTAQRLSTGALGIWHVGIRAQALL